VRLAGDKDPNTAVVEAAKRMELIEDAAAAGQPDRLDMMKPEQIAKLPTRG